MGYPKAKELFLKVSSSDKWIVVLLLIFSAAIRFPFLNAGLFHHDSVQLAVAVEKLVNDGELQGIGGGRHGAVLANAPFYYFFKLISGHESAEFAVNFASAFFGALSAAVLYLFLISLTNDRFIGFSSSILYSATPLFLSVSTFAKEHTLDAFLVLLSLLLLAKGMEKSKNALIFLAGFFLSSLIFVRFPSILMVLPASYLIYNYGKFKDNLIGDFISNKMRGMILYLAPFAILTLLYLSFSYNLFLNEIRSNFNAASPGDFLINNFWYSTESLIATLTIVGALFSIFGLALLFIEKRQIFYFLLLLFIPLFLFYALSRTVADRFFVVPLIALIVPISYSLGYIRKKSVYAAFVVLIILAGTFFYNIYPVIKLRSEFSAFKELGTLINDNTAPGDSVVIVYGDDAPAVNYYSRTPTRTCDYEPDADKIREFIAKIYGLMLQDLKVHISGSCFGLGTREQRELFLSEMDSSFKGVAVAEYVSDDYHRGTIKPTIRKVPMIKLYSKSSQKGENLRNLVKI